MTDHNLTRGIETASLKHNIHHLFVALTIVKLKPINSSIRDYLSQIRSSAQQSISIKGSKDRPLGSVAYWKAEHAKLKASRKTLNDRISALEQEVNEKSRLISTSALSVNSKRKRGRHDAEEVFGAIEPIRKQARIDGIEKMIQRKQTDVQEVVDVLESHLPCNEANTYLRQLYHLQLHLAYEAVDSQDMGAVVLQLSSTLLSLISRLRFPTLEPRPSNKGLVTLRYRKETIAPSSRNPPPVKETILRLVNRTFTYLLQGFNKLAENSGLKGQIKHILVNVFLEIIELITFSSRTGNTNNPSQVKPQKSSQRHPRKRPVAPSEPDQQHCGLMALCRLFVTMFASLDALEISHKDLIEGAMYVLLTRAGSLLKMFVFDGEQIGSEQVASSKSIQKRNDGRPEELLIAMQTEARYIIWILERVMHLQAPLAATRLADFGNSNAPSFNNLAPTPTLPLALEAQIKFQNTLLKAVFGSDDASFEERFRAPENPGLNLGRNIASVEKGDVKNWYKQEIWRLVGWDVLRKSID